jgi:molybdopterin-guanine dinucleotide biosynthesis protein A
MAVRPEAARNAVDAVLASGGRRSLMALTAVVPWATVPAETWRVIDPPGATLRDVDTLADLETG